MTKTIQQITNFEDRLHRHGMSREQFMLAQIEFLLARSDVRPNKLVTFLRERADQIEAFERAYPPREPTFIPDDFFGGGSDVPF